MAVVMSMEFILASYCRPASTADKKQGRKVYNLRNFTTSCSSFFLLLSSNQPYKSYHRF